MRIRTALLILTLLAAGCSEDTSTPAPTDTNAPDIVTPTETVTPPDVVAPETTTPETTQPETTEPDAGGGGGLGTCCEPDDGASACEAGLICLEVPGGTPTCHQPAGNAICNVDEDCGVGAVCKDVSLCDCQVDCLTEMGICEVVGFPTVCCSTDADCGDGGLMCVGGENDAGVCKPIPPPVYGPCWSDAACATGDICVGAMACPCNADCDMEDQIGTCEKDPNANPCGDAPKTGCGKSDECAAEEVCMFTDSCLPSTCSCNEDTGDWLCTADCAGGECVPAEQACGTDPSGCKNKGCPDGEVCGPSPEGQCIPSSCSCNSQAGTVGPWAWMCTKDCAGGVCQPK